MKQTPSLIGLSLVIMILFCRSSDPSCINQTYEDYRFNHNQYIDEKSHQSVEYPNIISDNITLQDFVNYAILSQVTKIKTELPQYESIRYQVLNHNNAKIHLVFTVQSKTVKQYYNLVIDLIAYRVTKGT